MIQPPKMSPLPFASAGIGITRSTSWRSSGRRSGASELGSASSAASPLARSLETSAILLHLRALSSVRDSFIFRSSLFYLSSSTDLSSMRPATLAAPPLPGVPAPAHRSAGATLKKLLPYVWQWRWRVLIALSFLVGAKVANVGVPLVLKRLVDALSLKPGDPAAVLAVPVALLIAYG